MEALQILKFHLKKEHIYFTEGWMIPEKEMVDDPADVDLLAGLLKENYQDNLDKLVKSINGNALGKSGKL